MVNQLSKKQLATIEREEFKRAFIERYKEKMASINGINVIYSLRDFRYCSECGWPITEEGKHYCWVVV